jgi:pyruvate formate lyase activating enzyme
VSVADVIRRVEEDATFYARSSGGLTLGGGEPLSQADFAASLLVAARNRGLDTAIETCGFCAWKAIESVAPHADKVFFDIKCIDSERHREITGVANEIILENFRGLRAQFPDITVVVRTPVITGLNDTEQEIGAIATFVAKSGAPCAYELLPYHPLGASKYARLGRVYRMGELSPPSEERMAALRQIADGGCS